MTSKQKKQGVFPAAYNAGGNYSEEFGSELGLTEQGKAGKISKANRTDVITSTTKKS